jgi:hypothetical protein
MGEESMTTTLRLRKIVKGAVVQNVQTTKLRVESYSVYINKEQALKWKKLYVPNMNVDKLFSKFL